MKGFNIMKGILGYLWALAVIPVVAMGFVNMSYFEQKLIVEPGFRVSERWTGGEIESVIRYDRFTATVHEPVFKNLIFNKNTGFVQIDLDFKDEPPEAINAEIDYDRDGNPDFNISLNTIDNTAVLKPYGSNAISISEEGVLVNKNSRSLRVVLKK